jgi:ABC-type multidrug transport system ATPase subunit
MDPMAESDPDGVESDPDGQRSEQTTDPDGVESDQTDPDGDRETSDQRGSVSGREEQATGESVLVADEVSHAYGDLDVLEEVSVSLDAGEVVALVGPNGSGKTTLLRILAGLLTPTDGRVSYRGSERDRELGYLPQQPAFRPGFSARETLGFYASLVDDDPDELLDRVGLGEAGDRNVEALSGGMTRLLGIAQATVGDPPVVLFDEPGSGLDPGMRRQTWEVVGERAEAGTAVVLSTHDTLLAEQFADRVLLLGDGQLQADGSPAALTEEYDCDSLQSVFETTVAGESGPVGSMGESS